MAERLKSINSQIQNQQYVDNSINYLHFTSFLSKEEDELRKEVRAFLESQVSQSINNYVDSATFPHDIAKKIASLKLLHQFFPPPFGKGISKIAVGTILAELARIDMGLATFVWLQYAVVGKTIDEFGNEQQKEKWLKQLIDMKIIGSFGLTEILHGSDANSIQSTVKLSPDRQGFILNGNKRWIGNGNRDIMIVWAKNLETKLIEAFIVDLHTQGISTNVIKHKLALRIVQNCEVTFENVFIPLENQLPKAKDFASGAAKALLFSRVFVIWLCVGICQGVYDNVSKYIQERKQFQAPIASYQLIQEKLVKIMSTTQALLLVAWRLTMILDKGLITAGQASMGKAWATERTREVARIGREMLGGNGIISDYYVMKAVTDAEVAHTYEGTYDINALVAGRELTGISSFKASAKN